MGIRAKAGVNLLLKTSFAVGVGWIASRWEMLGYGSFKITSAKDGDHRPGSAHRQDEPAVVPSEAVDISTLWGPNWIWTDKGAKAYYLNHGRLPEGTSWKEVGEHRLEFIRFLKTDVQPEFRVHVHPDWDEGKGLVPHVHVAEREPFVTVEEEA